VSSLLDVQLPDIAGFLRAEAYVLPRARPTQGRADSSRESSALRSASHTQPRLLGSFANRGVVWCRPSLPSSTEPAATRLVLAGAAPHRRRGFRAEMFPLSWSDVLALAARLLHTRFWTSRPLGSSCSGGKGPVEPGRRACLRRPVRLVSSANFDPSGVPLIATGQAGTVSSSPRASSVPNCLAGSRFPLRPQPAAAANGPRWCDCDPSADVTGAAVVSGVPSQRAGFRIVTQRSSA